MQYTEARRAIDTHAITDCMLFEKSIWNNCYSYELRMHGCTIIGHARTIETLREILSDSIIPLHSVPTADELRAALRPANCVYSANHPHQRGTWALVGIDLPSKSAQILSA